MDKPLTSNSNLVLVRHGESEANVGIPTFDFENIALTARGHAQARAVADACETPDQIITSPYLRARQTAEPFLKRHPLVPVSEHPVQEFAYLDAGVCSGTTAAQRGPLAQAFWQKADPRHREGPSSESFADLIGRADLLLEVAARSNGTTVVFTHCMFMQAVLHHLLTGSPSPSESSMRSFSAFARALTIANGEFLRLFLVNGQWTISGLDKSHLVGI